MIACSDSVTVYDEKFVPRKQWPTMIGGPGSFLNCLAFDENSHSIVLYDMNKYDFALLDVESGALSFKNNLGVLYGASSCGEHAVLIEPGGKSPVLLDTRSGKVEDIAARLPVGSGLRKVFSNDRWLACGQRLTPFGSSEKGRIFSFMDPNTLKVVFQDTVATDQMDSYVFALGKRHFAFSTAEATSAGNFSLSPRIYDLQDFNLTDPVAPAFNTLAAVYARQLLMPGNTLKQQLQATVLRNFNRQNESGAVFFSARYHYILYCPFDDKILKKKVGDSLIVVKNLGWNGQNISLAAFSPDERYLLVKRDSVVELIRTADGKRMNPLRLEHQIFGGALYCDNDHAWMIGDPNKVDLLDLKSLKWTSLTFPWMVGSISRIDSLNYVACTSNGIYLANVKTAAIKPLLNNHKTLMMLSDPGSQKIYTLMDDGTVRIIDLKDQGITSLSDGSSLDDLSIRFNETGFGTTIFEHFFLSDDRRYLVTHTRDDQIRVWDLSKGKVIFRTRVAGINNLMLDSKKQLLIALAQTRFGVSQDDVHVYSLATGATYFSAADEVQKIRRHPPAAISGLVNPSVSVPGQNGTGQPGRFDDEQLRIDPDFHYLWMISGQMLGVLDLRKPGEMKWSRSAMPFSIDGFRDSLAMVRANRWVGFLNPVTRDTVRVPFGPENYISSSGHFKGYSYAIIQRYDKDKGVLYDFKWYSESLNRLLINHRVASEIVDVVASRDRNYVATNTTNERTYPDSAFLFDARSGSQVTAIAGAYYKTFFSADGKYWVCLLRQHPAAVFDIERKKWQLVELDGLNVDPLAEGHLVKSDGELVDLENLKVYKTNLRGISEVSNGQAYGFTLTGEMGTYRLATNTFHNFSFQQTGGFEQALVSPDRHYLVTLGFDGFVSKWDLKTGLLAAQAPIDYEPQRTVYFNTDSTFVVTFNAYKATAVSLKTLRAKYVFSPGRNGTLNFFLDNGFYFADKADLNDYYFNYQGDLFGYTQFDVHLNRPDKVLEAMDVKHPALVSQYRDAVLKRWANQTVPDFSVAELHAPEIRILNERLLPVRQSADTVGITVLAEDTRTPLTDLTVTINGNPVNPGLLSHSPDGKKIEGRVLLHLGTGRNHIAFSCINKNNIASLVKTVEINCSGFRTAPKTYFVGIGLDHYQSRQLQRLNSSIKDVRSADSLLRLGGPVISDTLYDRRVTAAAIDSILTQLSATAVDDKVVIFFSGHGLPGKSGFYMSTYEVDPARPADKGYDFSRMEKLLAKIPARQKLVLIDACNSGQRDRDQSADDPYGALDTSAKQATGYVQSFDLMQDIFADVSSGTGAVVICASRSTQYANEGKNHGIFTGCLIEGIGQQAADSDGNGIITVEELKDYLISAVPKRTKEKQQPVARADIPGLDWPLLKLP